MKLHLLLFSALLSITLYSCKEQIDGCTDTNALNYNPDATCDDGTCIAKVFGCMDSTAYSYNPAANVDDASCIYAGCMDTASINYNPLATIDDGSCEYRGSVVFYANPAAYYMFGIFLNNEDKIVNCNLISEVSCGAAGCATFDNLPTQSGGQNYNYSMIDYDGSHYYGTVTIYPNTCTEKEIQ